jgi:hypothetical protein
VAPLERLLVLEIEYHRRLRAAAIGTADAAALHTSYALQSGYEPLLRIIGRVTTRDIERLGTGREQLREWPPIGYRTL